MKKIIMILMIGLLLTSVSVFAQDMTIDANGNIGIGETVPTAKLDVYTENGDAVVGTSTNGWAGYFDGPVRITGNLTFNGGTYAHTHSGSDILGGTMNNNLAVSGYFTVGEYIDSSENYKINNVTVLAVPGIQNTLVGKSAGSLNSGTNNSFFGFQAGRLNTGDSNTFIGNNAGQSNTFGGFNTFIGDEAGLVFDGGFDNIFIGAGAGSGATGGFTNVFIGVDAGHNNNGSGNVFIGNNAGKNEGGNNKLYIANSDTTTPLIHGDFFNDIVTINGDSTITGALNATTTTTGTLNATSTISDILKLSPSPSAPTCDVSNAGVLYHDSTSESALCWCSGSAWFKLAGNGTCS